MRQLHARAMGKAVLAHLDKAEITRFFDSYTMKKLTPKTKTRKKEILAELEQVKKRGYAFNDEEYVTGLICMGAPVMNYQTGTVAGAISLDFPSSEYSPELIERDYAGVVIKLANDISEMITMAES